MVRGTIVALNLFFAVSGFSQKEATNWCFSFGAGITFSTTPPSAATSSMYSGGGCATISDASGKLLFYTDGSNAWNKNHQLIANGGNLGGTPVCVQSALIVPKSGTQYYLFNTSGPPGILRYAIVDMSLAAGLGSVTVYGQTLAVNVTGRLAGTRHCNGKDFWIATHEKSNDAFLAFQVGPNGINTVPVVSNTGTMYPNSSDAYVSSQCGLKFSPNGRKAVIGFPSVTSQSCYQLLDFDNSTGVFTASRTFSSTASVYTIPEFSPDGTKLYYCDLATSTITVYQADLCTSLPPVPVGAYNAGNQGCLQNSVDGRIYFPAADNYSLYAITAPNLPGSACGFSPNVQAVSSGTGQVGNRLPNFISSCFRQKPSFTQTPGSCGSLVLTAPQLCAGTGYSVTGYQWNFGDGTPTSSLASVSHYYAANGTYTPQLILYYSCGQDTINSPVVINSLPTSTITGRMTICKMKQLPCHPLAQDRFLGAVALRDRWQF
jgi:hypothetical protein